MKQTEKKKNKVYGHKKVKAVLSVLVIILAVVLIIKVLPYFKLILTEEGREIFKQDIEKLGQYGYLVIIGLLLIKALFIFLPGEPLEILAGMCYGVFGGLLVVYIGIIISTCLIFLLVRILGRNFVYTFVSQERIEKLEKSKLFKLKKLEIILLILFIVPGTPRDLLVYLGAITMTNPIKFIIISMVARFPSLISSTIVGSSLLEGRWIFSVGIYLISFAISGVVFYIFNKKEKMAEEMKEVMKI